jgi:DedD protein
MMSTRRTGRARHEFRFGGRELAVLAAVLCLIASLVFAAGIVVGREMARARGARAEATRERHPLGPEGLPNAEAPVKTAATRAEEKVTFYRTLTAPTQDLPQVGKPTVEERLVPKDDPPSAPPVAEAPPDASRATPEPPRAVPERRVTKAEATLGPRPAQGARAPATGAGRPTPAQVAAAGATAPSEAWTVQVSAFRSRALADELRARLAARGFDAYIFPSITEDGRPRYRVRIGTYPTRNDAERVAADLRSERGLNPLVTPRTR